MNAVEQAERASRAWRSAVHAQASADPAHGEFYALAGELVDTLRTLESLTGVLARQVTGYGQGRVLRDDEGGSPGARLADSTVLLGCAQRSLGLAGVALNEFWSQIGHVAVEDGAR